MISIQDRQFALIQETWIYNNTCKPNSLNDVMSSRLATLVRDLGCEHYSCRENATEILLQQSNEDSIRALFWGSHHTNLEIANRCRIALHRSMICRHCIGKGECPRLGGFGGCECCFWIMNRIYYIKIDGLFNWEIRYLYQEKVCMVCFGDGITPLESFQ